jgi:hypothetical protein
MCHTDQLFTRLTLCQIVIQIPMDEEVDTDAQAQAAAQPPARPVRTRELTVKVTFLTGELSSGIHAHYGSCHQLKLAATLSSTELRKYVEARGARPTPQEASAAQTLITSLNVMFR